MEVKELNEALEGLKTDLKGATEKEIKSAIDAFGVKNSEAIELLKKEQKEAFDTSLEGVKSELAEKVKAVQDHADKLDVKLQYKAVNKGQAVDEIKSAITKNFDKIKEVKKGQAVEIKAVGDMSTANLTGDEHRDYNFDVVMIPNQKVNVSDLVGQVSISGGTYTYIRETGSEGAIATQTEGSNKSQIDYDLTSIDVSTDFIAGFARYSKKMKNNLPYLESFLPKALRRDYFKEENSQFVTVLAAGATASTEVITGSSKTGMLINEIGALEDADYDANRIVVRPSDYLDILKTAKQDLESAVTYENGILTVAGVQVVKATWLSANKYFVGDWSRVNKINTEGLSLEFSDVEGTNFVKNNITARIESQTALAVEQPAAIVYGDFTAV